MRVYVYTYWSTSAGSWLEMYLNPLVEFDPDYDPETDCYFHGTSSSSASCISTVTRTANYVHIKVEGSPSYLSSYPNVFPYRTSRYFYISNIKFPQITTNKYVFQVYFRLHESSGVNADTYDYTRTITVLPPRPSEVFKFHQLGNIRNTGYKYPRFLRFEVSDYSHMDYKE